MYLVLISPSQLFLQPLIAGGLGPIPNASASVAPILEHTDRIQQPASLGNLVFFYPSSPPPKLKATIRVLFFFCVTYLDNHRLPWKAAELLM